MKALAAALALAALLPASAAAATKEGGAESQADARTAEAKARFKRGTELYRQKRYREAAAEFQAAYRARPHGVLQYNIAQCQERMGDLPGALASYHAYLREVPDAEDRQQVRKTIAALEKRLAATGRQHLLVTSDPSGAEVSIEGKARGRTPLSAALAFGTYQLSLALPGFETARREVRLAKDRPVELALKLQAVASAPPAPVAQAVPPAPAAAPPSLSAPAPSPVPAPQAAPQKVERKKGRVWTWVAAGTAVALTGVGIGYGVAAKSDSNKLVSGQYTQPQVQQLYDGAKSKSGTANVFYGVAGAVGAVGVALFFVEGSF